MKALRDEFERRGWRVENNGIRPGTRACLFNSFNFDFNRLRRVKRSGCRMVHRVDGPIGVYRGYDDKTDLSIWEVNQELADATIFQSKYSIEKHREFGFVFKSPRVILNAADPNIFHPYGRIEFSPKRKIRLMSASWSDNPNKGYDIYQWLDDNLNWGKFEYTFVGRSPIHFRRIRSVPPVASTELASLLRKHDIFITASRHDPCSNALIEALSCGLPAIYLASGGHPEIVGHAGFGFSCPSELPSLIERLVQGYSKRQSMISLPTLSQVAEEYLAVMELESTRGSRD